MFLCFEQKIVMKNHIYSKQFFTLFLCVMSFCFHKGLAQKTLKDTMLIVVTEFIPTVADAYKISNMPVIKDSVPPVSKLTYFISPKKIPTPYTVAPINPAKMIGEPLQKLYNGLIKIGAGNYNTPYAEIFYNNGRSKKYSLGTRLKHFSSKANLEGYGFGGNSENEMELIGKKFMRKHTLSGAMFYDRDVIHYYGYDTASITITDSRYIKQRYAYTGSHVALQSHYADTSMLNYSLKLKYYHLSDLYKTAENNVYVSGDFSGHYEKQLIHLPFTIDYYNNRSAADTASSAIASLSPYISSKGDKWNLKLGIGMTIEGNRNDKSRFIFIPSIDFNYNVIENIIVPYAGITGGLKRNSLKILTDENPFLIPDPLLKNTHEQWKIYGGLRGSVSKTVSYNTSTSYSKVGDMYFFVNKNYDIAKHGFDLMYNDALVWNIHGELQFQHIEKIKLLAKGDYNYYDLAAVAHHNTDTTRTDIPWHRPSVQLSFCTNYNLKNKIIIISDIFFVGKRFAGERTFGNGLVLYRNKELKPIFDANFGIEYRYSKKLSAFLHLNNLGFKRYYLWNNYPSYKFNFLAGVTAAF